MRTEKIIGISLFVAMTALYLIDFSAFMDVISGIGNPIPVSILLW